MKNKDVVLCQSCHREQLQNVDEARVRFGAEIFENSSSSVKMSNTKQWTGVKQYKYQQKKDNGVTTSSLFNMPQGWDPGQKSGHLLDAPRNEGIKCKKGSRFQSATPSLFDVPKGYEIEKKIKSEKSIEVPASSSTQLLGGRVLAKRMQQQQSEISGANYEQKNSNDKEII